MIYSKFTDNQEDNEETTLVSSSTTPATTPDDTNLSVSVERLTKLASSTIKNTTRSESSLIKNQPTTAYTPYINRSHLKHLDTLNLERNMQIRHDLMIEEGYRASLPRLELSDEDEEGYWNSIRVEVAELQTVNVKDAPKLRALLSEIREMMIELYPKCDVVIGEFAEFLEDTQFIVQQIKNETLDICGFFQFLGNVMKKNCAPKRDALVDAMIANECPIEGLKSSLKLIELMKLDLANFKLDQLRPLIAKTAVSTERAFFSQLFQSGKISLDLTSKWLAGSTTGGSNQSVPNSTASTSSTASASSAYEAFLNAGIKLLVNPFVKGSNCNVPETFILDKKRLISLHGKFQDLCIVQCLLLIFKQAVSNNSASSSNLRKCFAANLLKGELLRLLEQPDTQIADISNLMIQCLRNSDIDSIDFKYIHSALNNIISPDNELFLLIEGKLLKRIESKLTEGDKISKSSSGLSELNVLEEFDELIKKFGILLQYNWNVFEPIYQNLLLKK